VPQADVAETPGVVAAGSPPVRTPVVVVTLLAGATLLGLTLGRTPGSGQFYALSLGLAAVWILGAIASGKLPLGKPLTRIRLSGAVLLALLTFAVFVVGDLVFRLIPPLHHAVLNIIDRADSGSLALVLLVAVINGIGEELFFRGALYDALRGRAPMISSTLIYIVVTACAWNFALVVAAAFMGVVWVIERVVSRGIVAPVITHVTWSVLMVLLLPR
jgi:membrane protease YdiL (CAAX protease family)